MPTDMRCLGAYQNRATLEDAEKNDDDRVTFEYTNYRGEKATRLVIPHRIYYGSTEWHRDDQWLMEAYDCERRAMRTFAMNGIKDFFEMVIR